MRIFPMTAVLGLAIVVGGAMADSAMSASNSGGGNPAGSGQMSANTGGGGGGGGGGNSRDPGFSNETPDGRNSAARSHIRECPNGGIVGIDCPPKKIFVEYEPTTEGDCQCKPVAISVGGKTQIVLDCYQTKLYNNVRRTYRCARPE